MVYLAPPQHWKLWPGLAWFVTPSGGHAPPWSLWTRLTEMPLAHGYVGTPVTAALGWLVFGLADWRLWGFVVLAQGAWQMFNIERRAYSPETAVGQAFWRILIGAVAGLPVLFL